MLEHHRAVAAHAYELATRWTLVLVTRQQTGMRAAFQSRLFTSQITCLTRVTRSRVVGCANHLMTLQLTGMVGAG